MNKDKPAKDNPIKDKPVKDKPIKEKPVKDKHKPVKDKPIMHKLKINKITPKTEIFKSIIHYEKHQKQQTFKPINKSKPISGSTLSLIQKNALDNGNKFLNKIKNNL